MNSNLLSTLTLGICCLTAGCAGHTPSSVYPLNGQMLGSPAAQVRTDSEILGTLVVLNNNEIAAAQLARRHGQNMRVKNYANFMVKEHGTNLRETKRLSQKLDLMPDLNGRVAMNLQQKGQQQLQMLQGLNGKAFDSAYMATMVNDHTAALSLVGQLYNQTSNPMLQNQLKMTRAHIAEHLQRASVIQRESL